MNDTKLWNDFIENKKYALSHIYYQHIEDLFNYGIKITSDHDLVKDSIQEVFFYLIRNRKNLGQTDNIKLYLFKSLRHRIFKALKKRQKLQLRESELLLEKHEINIVYSYEEEIIDKENLSKREEQLLKCIQSLSPKQREILYYRFSCDFSYEEISSLMSINYDSARKQVYRAIKALRAYVDENKYLFVIFSIPKKN